MENKQQDALLAYKRMLRIRLFEEAVEQQMKAGLIPGSCHSSIGHEGAIVGACVALRDDDYITGTHRSHGHPIGKGADLKPLMAELMGKVTGVCKGRGGSMHLADASVGIIGESAIVGGGLPIATGAGLRAQVQGTDQVSLCFFGDGASNQGTFHESINMAAMWKLPVIYFCENNLYAATTSVLESHGQPEIARRAEAYGIPGVSVDGQDVEAVYAATATAVERARRGEGPTLIEAKTYRFDEHAIGLFIPAEYRSSEEVESWQNSQDPIQLYRKLLLAKGIADASLLQSLSDEISAEVAAAVEFAKASDFPAAVDVGRYMFANPVDQAATTPAAPAESKDMTYFEAIFQAEQEEMDRDESVILIGEDITLYSATGLLSGIEPQRMRSAPISENSFTGMGVGAAITGLRPIVDLTIASFCYLASDQIINQAAKLRYMTGGQAKVPVVFRASMWHNASNAAQHSDRPYPMFMNVPGLKVLAPSTPADMKGLLKAAIRDDDPVLIFEDNDLWFKSGPVPEGDFVVPIGKADIKREGSDVTIVSIAGCLLPALEAAEALAAEGISAEVIDPRTLVPLDKDAILESVAKTGRLVVVDYAHKTNSAAAEIAAIVVEEGFEHLRGPVQRVTTPDINIPFSPALERDLYPNSDDVVAAVKRLVTE